MSKYREVYITREEFALKEFSSTLYEGFVVGDGYAYFLPEVYFINNNSEVSADINAVASPFTHAQCTTMWVQYFDDSPEAKMRSLGEDPTKWTDFLGSTKLQRFAAQEFARSSRGEIANENKSDIHVIYNQTIGITGNTSSYQCTQYFRDNGTLIPQSGEIKQYVSNWREVARDSWAGQTWVVKVVYGILGDAYITVQNFTIGHVKARHISGEFTVGGEALDAGISTITNFLPVGRVGKGMKAMDAIRFNSVYKGVYNTKSQLGTRTLRKNNVTARELEALRRQYKYFGIGV